jgi:hypothetical protein
VGVGCAVRRRAAHGSEDSLQPHPEPDGQQHGVALRHRHAVAHPEPVPQRNPDELTVELPVLDSNTESEPERQRDGNTLRVADSLGVRDAQRYAVRECIAVASLLINTIPDAECELDAVVDFELDGQRRADADVNAVSKLDLEWISFNVADADGEPDGDTERDADSEPDRLCEPVVNSQPVVVTQPIADSQRNTVLNAVQHGYRNPDPNGQPIEFSDADVLRDADPVVIAD